MPLKLNIGLARKIGEANYGSRGASVNVELELESALISEPAKLQDRIRQLFGIVRDSLTEELNGNSKQSVANDAPAPGHPNGAHASNGHGHASQPPSQPTRMATASQVRALHSICKSQRLNLSQLAQDRFRVDRPEDLSIRQASQLIDELKAERT